MDDLMDTTPVASNIVVGLSPNSKAHTLVLEAHLCNGKSLTKDINFGDTDIENIWCEVLKRDWLEINGFKQRKVADNAIRIIYELVIDEPIRSIVDDPEVTYARKSLFGPQTFTLRVIGLNEIREANIGDKVRVNARGTDFVVKPVEILEWMEHFGEIVGEHR